MGWFEGVGKEAALTAKKAYDQYIVVSVKVEALEKQVEKLQQQVETVVEQARADANKFHERIAALEGLTEAVLKQSALEALRSVPELAALVISGKKGNASATISAARKGRPKALPKPGKRSGDGRDTVGTPQST